GYTAHKQNPACEYIIPQGETIVNGDPIALVVTSKHPEAAKAFIAWVLTEGQKVWLDPTINRLPANPRIFETPEGQKRPDLKEAFETALKAKAIAFNDTLALMYEEVMRNYFKATLVDSNSELKKVWVVLLNKLFKGEIDNKTFHEYLKKLGSPLKYVDPVTGKEVVFTQEDAIRVNKLIIKDPALLDKYMLAWKQAASKRYSELLKELTSS
ncbi:MAG: ABC transporter substrate-binding protein, partial [Thermoprotei archaeon]